MFGFNRLTYVLCLAFLSVLTPRAAHADLPCSSDPAHAVTQAKSALDINDPQKDRAALVCLTKAVEALDEKLSNLLAGKIDFTGAITAPAYFYPHREMQDGQK